MNKVSGSTTVKGFFFFSFFLFFSFVVIFISFFFPVAHLVRNLLTRLDVSSNPGTWDYFFPHTPDKWRMIKSLVRKNSTSRSTRERNG